MRFDIPEKLSFTLFFVLLAIASPWFVNAASFALLLLLRLLIPSFRPSSRTVSRNFRKIIGTLLLAAVFMTLANGFFIREGHPVSQVLGFTLFSEGLLFGLRIATRLLVISTTLLVFFGSTPLSRIASFLHHAGLPPQLVMTLMLTLHFVEQLPARIDKIFTAQEARGAPLRSHVPARIRSLFVVLAPLLLSSIVESIDRGMALELRGFHGNVRLSFGDAPLPSRAFSPVVILFLFLSAGCLVWITAQWLLL